jgi:hypothetical protein
MSAERSLHIDSEYKDSDFQTFNETKVQAQPEPSGAAIKEALQAIRPHGLQNLVAIREGEAPRGETFEFPAQLDGATEWALKQNQASMNLYFTVNPVRSRIRKKPTKDDLAGAEYAHVDIDPDVSCGYGEGRRRLLEEVRPMLEDFQPKPALIIDSGNGLGAFWRMDEAEIADTEQLNKQLIAQFGGDAGTWNVDRLMRLPGTLNYPSKKKLDKGYPEAPSLATLLVYNRATCFVDQLSAALPELEPAHRAEEKTRVVVKEGDGTALRSLTEDEQKQVDLRLQTALEQSPKLRERWEGSTEGLKDTTRSGMDFSVAAMLKARGFTSAETAYLLTECFEYGKGSENTERDLLRCWERSESTAPTGSVRAWINKLYTTEEAAQDVALDPEEMAGLDAYSILLRGNEANADQDSKELKAKVVRKAHKRALERMTFQPGPVAEDIYNSWTGFPAEPIEGDWSLMQQLIREGLCDGNEEHYEWLLDWMAVGLQKPTVRYGAATVLCGEKGVGKGQFAKWYGKLFGNHYLQLSNPGHLVGNFNAHLERALLVFADELIWGGKKQEEGVLKALVTEELTPIEGKGWDTEMRKNYTRLLVASNEDWAVPASIGERRWFVLDVSSKYRQKTEFFAALQAQMKNRGVEAMMHDLLNREIKTNQRMAPSTKALADVALLGLDDVAAWLHESLSSGALTEPDRFKGDGSGGLIRTEDVLQELQQPESKETPGYCGASVAWCMYVLCWPYAVKKDTLYASFQAHAKTHNRYGRVRDRARFFGRFRQLLPSAQEQRPKLNGKQERILILPRLEDAREEFKRTSNLDFDFEDAA